MLNKFYIQILAVFILPLKLMASFESSSSSSSNETVKTRSGRVVRKTVKAKALEEDKDFEIDSALAVKSTNKNKKYRKKTVQEKRENRPKAMAIDNAIQNYRSINGVQKRKVLLIGIDRFADKRIPELFGCERDVRLLGYAFQALHCDVTILTSQEATLINVLEAIIKIRDNSVGGQTPIIYISSHGSNTGSVLCYDSTVPETSFIQRTLVDLESLDSAEPNISAENLWQNNALQQSYSSSISSSSSSSLSYLSEPTQLSSSAYGLNNELPLSHIVNELKLAGNFYLILDCCLLKGPAIRGKPIPSNIRLESQNSIRRDYDFNQLFPLPLGTTILIGADEGQRALEVRRKNGGVMGLVATCLLEELLWRLPIEDRPLGYRSEDVIRYQAFELSPSLSLSSSSSSSSSNSYVNASIAPLSANVENTCPGCPRCCGCARCDVPTDTRIAASRSSLLPINPVEDMVLQSILRRVRLNVDRLSAHVQQPIILPWPSFRS